MDLFELLGEVIGLGCVAFLLYNEGILPRSLNSFFQKVKDGYRKVEAGELSYIAFKEDLRNKCYHRMQIESLQTIRFKEVLLGMLNYDDFIKQSLSNPDITVEELQEKWEVYDLSGPNLSVPEVFNQGKGKAIMAQMVAHGYCKSSSLCWIYDGDNSSYLMALFADAIGRELGFGRRRWRPFIQLWGNKNYCDLFEKAKNSDNRLKMEEKVRAIFPGYTIPK